MLNHKDLEDLQDFEGFSILGGRRGHGGSILLYSPTVSQTVPAISVIVPCLNEAGSIERLLEAVRLQDCPLHEVIVVDTGSSDCTLDVLKAYQARHPDFPLSFRIKPLGTIPDALNAGIAASSGEVIVRVDAHSRPIDSYVRKSVETLLKTGAGVVGGIWTISPGADGPTARAIARAASHPLGAGDAAYRTGIGAAGLKSVDTVPFGCYRRSTWEKLGGYNEKLLTNEDYEFNYRIRLGGQQVILDSEIRCTYTARAALKDLAVQYFRYGWWKAQMLRQHPGSIRLRQAIPVGFVASALALACAAIFNKLALAALALQLGAYALALAAASIRAGFGTGDWPSALILPAAFSTIHFSWGSGMLANVITLGSWPEWSRKDRPA